MAVIYVCFLVYLLNLETSTFFEFDKLYSFLRANISVVQFLLLCFASNFSSLERSRIEPLFISEGPNNSARDVTDTFATHSGLVVMDTDCRALTLRQNSRLCFRDFHMSILTNRAQNQISAVNSCLYKIQTHKRIKGKPNLI